jgi:peptide/nickel transport system permease protein
MRLLRAIGRSTELSVACAMMAVLVAFGLLGPLVWRADPNAVNVLDALLPPSLAHPMGTDDVGRDILSRFNAGARISLAVATIVTLASMVIGGLLGIIGGLFRGWVDAAIMTLMDSILAFPPLIFAVAVALALGAGVEAATIGIAITAVPFYARLLRSDVLKIREMTYIEAATAAGISAPSLIVRHIVPQLYSTLLIEAAAVFGFAILTLAALGFVGLGAQPPTPEWGNMITEGLPYSLTGQWWLGVFPGIGVLVASLATGMIADRLRDFYDPKAAARQAA